MCSSCSCTLWCVLSTALLPLLWAQDCSQSAKTCPQRSRSTLASHSGRLQRGEDGEAHKTSAEWDRGGGLRCYSGNTACGCSGWSVINTGVKARGHGLKHTRACRINTRSRTCVSTHNRLRKNTSGQLVLLEMNYRCYRKVTWWAGYITTITYKGCLEDCGKNQILLFLAT